MLIGTRGKEDPVGNCQPQTQNAWADSTFPPLQGKSVDNWLKVLLALRDCERNKQFSLFPSDSVFVEDEQTGKLCMDYILPPLQVNRRPEKSRIWMKQLEKNKKPKKTWSTK